MNRVRDHRRLAVGCLHGLVAVFLLASPRAQTSEWRLSIRQNQGSAHSTPVVLPVSHAPPPGNYVARATGREHGFAVQVFEDSGRLWLAAVLPRRLRVGEMELAPVAADAGAANGGVLLKPSGPNLVFMIDNHLFAEHRVDAGAKPFLYPLIGPTGASYTRGFPMDRQPDEDLDHPHQRSFWFTYGKVNGIDFWSEEEHHGTIRELDRMSQVSGPVAGRLRTRDEWLGPDGAKVCEDERVLTVYGTTEDRVLDFEITLKATDGPVRFGDTKEGMLGLRVASSMDAAKKTGGKITSSEGMTDEQAWGKPASWVDYTGPVNGKTVGIAILNHPKSFRYPTAWHVRPYGLFAANPFGWHDFGLGKSGEHVLPKGETLWFGYRVILHQGDTEAAAVGQAFAAYASEPAVSLRKP